MNTYEWADSELTGRCKNRRKVGNNTYLERLGDDIGLLYHQTHVIVWKPNGDIVLDSGGWRTYTTKERLTNFLPGRSWVRQERGVWYVLWHGVEHRYADGMILHPNGAVTGAVDEVKADKIDRANRNKRKAIKAYLNSITPEKITYAWEHPQGDPWLIFDDSRQLLDTVQNRRFHATLAFTAIKAANYINPEFIMQHIYADAQRGQVSDFLTGNLGKYLRKHILEGVATR